MTSVPRDTPADLRARLEALPPERRATLEATLAERGIRLGPEPGPCRGPDDPPETTVKQEALWHRHGSATDDGAFYHVAVIAELDPATDPDDVGPALRGVADRHDVLRCGYRAGVDGAPVCRDDDPPALTRVVLPVDGAAEDRHGRERVLDAARLFTAEVAAQPFTDLTTPPIRWQLLDARPVALLLVVVAHDIALDAYGVRHVLVPELVDRLAGTVPTGSPARLRDVARWQRRSLRGRGDVAVQVARQVDLLVGCRTAPLPDRGVRSGARVPLVVPAELTGRLARVARRERAGLAATVLTGWCRAVAGLLPPDGDAPTMIGVCTSGRHRPETVEVLGNLANTVVVPVPVGGPVEVSEIHRRLAVAVADVDAPFELVIAGRPDGSPGPVQDEDVRIRFTFHEQEQAAAAVDVHDVELGSAKASLNLELTRLGDRLVGSLDHRPADVPHENAAALARRLLAELDGLSR